MNKPITTHTTIKLRQSVITAMQKRYGAVIQSETITYAVNLALSEHLGILAPSTRREINSKTQKARWRKERAKGEKQ